MADIPKAEFLEALEAGFEMPPEEAEALSGGPPTMHEMLCRYPARTEVPPDGTSALAARVWLLLAPYYEQKAQLERNAWHSLAQELSDEEWSAMWLANRNGPSVARTLEQLRAFPVLLDPASHPATNVCPLAECIACSVRDCPFREPFHYHHDGCPACCRAKS